VLAFYLRSLLCGAFSALMANAWLPSVRRLIRDFLLRRRSAARQSSGRRKKPRRIRAFAQRERSSRRVPSTSSINQRTWREREKERDKNRRRRSRRRRRRRCRRRRRRRRASSTGRDGSYPYKVGIMVAYTMDGWMLARSREGWRTGGEGEGLDEPANAVSPQKGGGRI